MQHTEISAQLASLTKGFTPVIGGFTQEDYISLDLSVNNTDFKHFNADSSQSIGDFIKQYLSKKGTKIAYGGYNEKRDIYNRSTHFTTTDAASQRNIHLGVDIWADAGTPVLTPVSGKVHSFKDNTNHGDYGPCIILEHTTPQLTFYTLYGHLSRESLIHLKEGQTFKAGAEIATLGKPFENGDYSPHLHFQVICDMQGKTGDYPGVSSKNDLNFYLENCPNPNLLLKI
ncbi:peptidoglycan DD-metalloendopeptidase family protein [Leeuwenhoekiella sp. A16]|uniref:peptidoglycan DD-metalloendopeptidase family protein n=1 Tax=unclassified Leeuwenhoekiella TaxID=2615029 RepID=UPI003A805F16